MPGDEPFQTGFHKILVFVLSALADAQNNHVLAFHKKVSLFSALPLLSLLVFLALASGSLAGCPRERPADHLSSSQAPGPLSPPSLIKRAVVEPDPILRDEPVKVTIDVDENGGRELKYEYQWLINRVAVHGATATEFEPEGLRRGDVVHVEITGTNEKGERAFHRTPGVTVGNAPPIIEHVVEQDLARRRLIAKVEASDADDDEIHLVYRWWRNDKMVSEGATDTFDAGVAENDVVTVEVIPHDIEGAGESVKARPLVGSNNPPNIVSHPNMMSNVELYEYAVEAKDPEGDAVIFELETGPTGMVIDRTIGRVT
ncbi:MAG TPA: hypothetical protein VJR69_10925 [Nitrospira sp.]|nr:hypothetical protein [Nitrospira sp.]